MRYQYYKNDYCISQFGDVNDNAQTYSTYILCMQNTTVTLSLWFTTNLFTSNYVCINYVLSYF